VSKPTMPPPLGSATEAAALLGIKRGTFYAWVSQGKLPPEAIIRYFDNASVYDLDVLTRWRESKRGKPAAGGVR
jgi:predicted site-specific integrase-resolvase